jgi:tetratricopeptide (TPR) repeat protein
VILDRIPTETDTITVASAWRDTAMMSGESSDAAQIQAVLVRANLDTATTANPEALALLADAAFLTGDTEAAMDRYDRLADPSVRVGVETLPSLIRSVYILAQTPGRSDDAVTRGNAYAEALVAALRSGARGVTPNLVAEAHAASAAAYTAAEDPEAADAALTKALAADAANPSARIQRAEQRINAGNRREADVLLDGLPRGKALPANLRSRVEKLRERMR